jgi:chromosome segregation ATPase
MSDDEMTTQPTIETVLTRFDHWGARFIEELSEIRKTQQELQTGQQDLNKSVEELRTGQQELQTGQQDLRKSVEELRKGQVELRADLNTGLRRVERKIEILNDNLLTIKADIRDLEVRLEKVESESLTRS